MRRALAAAALGLLAGLARADPFPTRGGESGLLDVPSAETAGRGSGLVYGELRYDHAAGSPDGFGPFPISIVAGLGGSAEVGLALREWAQAGDPRPAPLLFRAALKLHLASPSGLLPGLALDGIWDRFNWKGTGSVRLIASTADLGLLRLAAVGGGEFHGPSFSIAPAGGLAAAVRHGESTETVLEALGGPGGPQLGVAVRRWLGPALALSLGLDWLPSDRGFRVSLGLGAGSARPAPKPRAPEEAPPPAPARPPEPAKPPFLDDRPHFRLRIPTRDTSGPDGRPGRVQPPGSAASEAPAAAAPQAPAPPRTSAAPAGATPDRLAAREADLNAAEAELAGREARLASEARKLDAAERGLVIRERQLRDRERRLRPRARLAPLAGDDLARDRADRAAEAAAAQAERGSRAGAGRARALEAAARAREGRLAAPLARLQADLSRATAPSRQADLGARVRAARERSLAALGDRLGGARARIEHLERADASRAERLAARGRRLDAAGARLATAEEAAAAQAAAGVPAPGAAAPPEAARAAGAPAERVAAAGTLVYFPAAGRPMRQADRKAVEAIARLAAREGYQVLVWARARNPGLMAEAGRRAEELKRIAARAGPLPANRIVTRLSVHPFTRRVDVVVSALRQPPAAPGSPATPGAPLAEGEDGKRQIREAVLQYRSSIQECLGDEMSRRGLEGGEASLRLRVDRNGRVVHVDAGESLLASPELERCLRAAAADWRLPASGAEYAVEVPVTMLGRERKR